MMPLLCWGACKQSLLGQAVPGCDSCFPGGKEHEGFAMVFEQTLLSLHRLEPDMCYSPIASLVQVELRGASLWPQLAPSVPCCRVVQEQGCRSCCAL